MVWGFGQVYQFIRPPRHLPVVQNHEKKTQEIEPTTPTPCRNQIQDEIPKLPHKIPTTEKDNPQLFSITSPGVSRATSTKIATSYVHPPSLPRSRGRRLRIIRMLGTQPPHSFPSNPKF
ncbi:hypothetical protein TNCV_169081 [Trichonephila clavipes]|nr:hypothetical protein TNCV_169081 [Trichonephila clavipes]